MERHTPAEQSDNADPANPGDTAVSAVVVPLNQAGAVFDALATEIRGSAAGWSQGAIQRLEQALVDRYGPLIGGQAAVERLLVLAQEECAA